MEKVTPLKRKKPTRPRRPRGRRVLIAIGAAVVLALVALLVYFRLYVEWLWFDEVGLTVVFWREFWWRLLVGVLFAAVFFAIFYGNIAIARRLAPRHRLVEGVDVVEYVNEQGVRIVRVAGLAVSLVVAVVVGVGASGDWLVFLRALHGVPFGIDDPVFGHDYSFYVFTLPAWRAVYSLVVDSLVAGLVAAIAVHAVLGAVTIEQAPAATAAEGGGESGPFGPLGRRRPGPALRLGAVRGAAIAHVSALLGLVFAVAGFGYLFKVWDLLFSDSGVVSGAAYTDLHARLPGMRVLMVVAWALAAMLIVNAWRRRWRWPIAAVVAWIAAAVIVSGIWPALTQSLIVNPNQEGKEKPYITRNIEGTRAAYNLASISREEYPLKGDLTPAKLSANDATLRNIRLWDPSTLLTSYRQLQELRPYYYFTDVDVDRYRVNGVYRQVMLSAREMRISGLPSQAQTWVNQHITYTHGFGAVASAVNQVTPDGSPDFLVQDVPPVSGGDLKIDEPRIYFGELGTDYTLVGTKLKEFDYPGGSGDVFTEYKGSGGIPIGSTWNRLAFTLRFGTIKFFTSTYIDGDSRVILRKDIAERVRAAAPFLSFDRDPYVVIADGRLYWIVDAYTTSDRYPYSQPLGEINYIRNSVKVVVDAYNGTMTLYAFDPSDPLLKTYEAIFPGMFTPMDEMPAVLKEHVRYPEDYFNVQSEQWATYHVTDATVLYNKGDQWQIPKNVALSGEARMDAYYVIMRLPGTEREEFLLMLPFVPNGRSNMISWLGARSDMPNYGKAIDYAFPQNATVYGPSQVEAAINQDPDISAQLTLWGQQGSSVINGNLLVMPIEDSLLYVQPLYLQSSQTGLPQLKRVIVFYRATTPAGVAELGGQEQLVVMRATLGESLAAIFGAAPPAAGPAGPPKPSGQKPEPGTTGVSAQVSDLITQANRQYEAAQQALKGGDWGAYGREVEALGQTLRKLRAAQ